MTRSDLFNHIMTDESIDMMLRQMDAKEIVSKTGQIANVTFEVAEGIVAEYTYQATEDGDLYMQRLKPIPRNIGKIKDISDMIKEISYDLRNYKHAVDAGLFDEYINMARSLRHLRREFEDLFLMYSPEKGSLDEFNEKIEELHESIEKTFL